MPASALSAQHCEACPKDTPPLSVPEAQKKLKDLKGWILGDGGKALEKEYLMKDFLAACEFIQEIAKTAEAEDHHPDLHLTGYRKLRVVLSTHSIGGLSTNDFILAAKIDELPKQLKG